MPKPPAEQQHHQPPRPGVDDIDDDAHRWGRLRVEATPAVVATLRACAACASAPADVRAAAAAAAAEAGEAAAGPRQQQLQQAEAGVPWRLVQRACECNNSGDGAAPPARHIRELLLRSSPAASAAAAAAPARLLLPSPPPPKPRPPELVARLERFREMLEDQRYAAALKDSSPAEAAEVLRQMRRRNRGAEQRQGGGGGHGGNNDEDDDEDAPDLLPSTRLQLSFGLQVIVTMGAFFALGYYGGRAATGGSATGGALLGTLGLVAALLLETSLFVVRSSPRLRAVEKKYGHLMARARDGGGGGLGGFNDAGPTRTTPTMAWGTEAAAAAAGAAAPSSLRQRRRPA